MSLAVLRAVSGHEIHLTSSAASATEEIGCSRLKYMKREKEKKGETQSTTEVESLILGELLCSVRRKAWWVL